MRIPLSALDGRSFDVAVIGAGANGASAAQHLAAAGYSVLLVERRDFGSGSSSRSSRLLHCGLRYLAPGRSMWEFVAQPARLKVALTMAREAMRCRRQFVQTARQRVEPIRFHFPIWEGSPYATWQVDLALKVLAALAPGDVPLDNRTLTPAEARRTPLVSMLRDMDKLKSVAAFCEYRFEWPERIVMDMVLDAERLGATTRNYTAAEPIRFEGGSWRLRLKDVIEAEAAPVEVTAGIVLNMAGIWIDKVNQVAAPKAPRRINGTKGVHIAVQLPPDCAGYGVATLNSLREGFYCIPMRGIHYFGPTETPYSGDPDGIAPTEDEIAFLLAEANALLPSLGLKRTDVLYAWAGVRPLGNDPAFPEGKRSRELHDLAADGLPNMLALTAGPVMTHRSAGPLMVEAVRRKRKPSGAEQPVSYAARLYPENQNSPPLLMDDTAVKLADLRFAAEREQVTSLTDLLFRRTGVGWNRGNAIEGAERAAETVAETLGWNPERVAAEVAGYREYLRRQHAIPSIETQEG